MNDAEEIEKLSEYDFSENDLSALKKELLSTPQGVETTVVHGSEIIYSSFSNLPDYVSTITQLWDFIKKNSNQYIYQTTSVSFESTDLMVFTRFPRQVNRFHKRQKMTESLFLILFFLVVNCFFIIIYISRTVFRSIKILEKQTQDIASGKLDTKIDIPINKTNEITSISDSIEKMRLSLIDEENRKNKFIMGISHDLRTPVAIIKGYTEALRDGVITEEEFKNTLTLIDTKANQLNGMIDTLINFVKLETSDWRQNLHNGSITKLIIEFGQNTESTCRVFNRIPLININLNEDFFIPLDPQLVNRVFENLMSNALRYTDENDRISIIAFKQDNKILLKISDTGYGISKTDLNHIFDLFYRGSSSRREEGMGIGLSVVKTIIDTLGWSIGVESIVKEGTTFTITIPL